MSSLPDPIPTITWRNTFNGHLSPKPDKDKEYIKDLANYSGYPYFSFNKRVYETLTGNLIDVSITDLDYYL